MSITSTQPAPETKTLDPATVEKAPKANPKGAPQQQSTLQQHEDAPKSSIFSKVVYPFKWVFQTVWSLVTWPFRIIYFFFCGSSKQSQSAAPNTQPPTLQALLKNPEEKATEFINKYVAKTSTLIDEFLANPAGFLELLSENPKEFNRFSAAIAKNEDVRKFLAGEGTILDGISRFIDILGLVGRKESTDDPVLTEGGGIEKAIKEALVACLGDALTTFATTAKEHLKLIGAGKDINHEGINSAHQDLLLVLDTLIPELADNLKKEPTKFANLFTRVQKAIERGSFSTEEEFKALLVNNPDELPEALKNHELYSKLIDNSTGEDKGWVPFTLISLFTSANQDNYGLEGVDLSIAFRAGAQKFMETGAKDFIKQVRKEIIKNDYRLAKIFCEKLETLLADPAYGKALVANFAATREQFAKAKTAINEAAPV
ncbi:MAG: hypothetical protein KR126chlam1_00869 [Chlamydiae bacterium]|nr:hypothetical protein [Chlamydiota bacterium]